MLQNKRFWIFPVQPRALVSCIQPGLVICFTLDNITYMFRCCSLDTSHPRFLPPSPKVCSAHLCLFFCFPYRVIITIFLNSLGRPREIRWSGRWEGGSGWGIHVNLWLIHVNVQQKPLQYCKAISLQLMEKNFF